MNNLGKVLADIRFAISEMKKNGTGLDYDTVTGWINLISFRYESVKADNEWKKARAGLVRDGIW